MRWLIGQDLGKPDIDTDADLVRAFQSMQRAFETRAGRGFDRQHLLNSIEAARLHILVMYGERGADSRSAWLMTVAGAARHLGEALDALTKMGEDAADRWLLALTYRLASYFGLIAGARGPLPAATVPEPLMRFIARGPDDMARLVEETYNQFAVALGDATACDRRIKYFAQRSSGSSPSGAEHTRILRAMASPHR